MKSAAGLKFKLKEATEVEVVEDDASSEANEEKDEMDGEDDRTTGCC
jgi:hypothetical protein